MALAAKAYNIFNIVSTLREKKLPHGDNMMNIKPSSISYFCFTTDFTLPFSSFPSQSANLTPQTIIGNFASLPIRMLFFDNVFRNPFSPTFSRTKITPNMSYQRRRSLKCLPTIITMKQLTVSLFPKAKMVEYVQIHSSFSAINVLGYFRCCMRRIISTNIIFLFLSPSFSFKPLGFLRASYRAIFSISRRISAEFFITIKTFLPYHNLIISRNFIRCKYPEVEVIDREDILILSK